MMGSELRLNVASPTDPYRADDEEELRERLSKGNSLHGSQRTQGNREKLFS